VSFADCTEKSDLIQRARDSADLPSSSSSSSSSKAAAAAKRHASEAASAKPTDPVVERILALPPRQYYALLGVPSNANADTLKKAYRHLALKLHPDKCHARGADEAFKRISAAFAVLSDSRQRAAHDFSGGDASAAASSRTSSSAGPSYGGVGGFRGGHGGHGGFGDKDAEDLFRAFFGSDEDVLGAGGASTGSASAGGSSVAGFDGTALAQRATRALALGQRLMATFRQNPWALVTLLSGLASLVSVFESLISIFGRWLTVVIPVAAVGVATCPPQQRRKLAIALAMLLCSGLFF
jgi:curved DNA-binding protein CbpA